MQRFKLLQKASAFCQRLCRQHRQVVVSGPTEATVPRSSSCSSNPANVSRYRKQTPPCSSILAGGDVVATEMKEVVDLVVGGEEALRLAGCFEPLYLPLASAGWLVRILGPVVQSLSC